MIDKKKLIPFARDFALKAHAGRVTTTANGLQRPQVIHLQEVADLVWASGGTDEEIAAAWLHDMIEDTSTTLEEITAQFGEEVAAIVDGLTDPEGFAALPVAERKQKQAARIKNASEHKGKSESVRRVKLADQTSNVRNGVLDGTAAMTSAERNDYIEGAKFVADECKGVSPLLDGLFAEAYQSWKNSLS